MIARIVGCIALLLGGIATAEPTILSYTHELDVVLDDFNGEWCWFHPRATVIPPATPDADPAALMTLQKWFLSASDYFSGLSTIMRTPDGTWAAPEEVPQLAWRDEADGITVGVCDFTPGWHPHTGKVLGIGHTVRYKDGHLMKSPRPRETAYAVYDIEAKTWTPWQTVVMPDDPQYFSAGSGCGQWLAEPDGTVMVPFYFRGPSDDPWKATYSSAVMRCRFDGTTLTFLEQSNALTIPEPRGIYEPSLTWYDGRYYLTLRNDVRGYVSVSDDGKTFAPVQPWRFDDGEELGNYNTQQHWVTHSDGLFLAYTRRAENNDHIMRHRAPIWFAQVDPATLTVIRSTEQVVVPERGARLGNFGVTTFSADESWVTVGEGMYEMEEAQARGANGRVYAARIQWSKPNTLVPRRVKTLVAFGDSITAPRMVDGQALRVYADVLTNTLSTRTQPVRIVNAGVGGNDTGQARARFEKDVLAHAPDIVVMQFGANDAAADVWKDPPVTASRISVADYTANLRHFVTTLREQGATPVLMTPNPLRWTEGSKKRWGKTPYDVKDVEGLNRLLPAYADAVRALAQELDVALVDVFTAYYTREETTGRKMDEWMLDGIHPNTEGQQLTADLLLPVLRPLVADE